MDKLIFRQINSSHHPNPHKGNCDKHLESEDNPAYFHTSDHLSLLKIKSNIYFSQETIDNGINYNEKTVQ